MKIYEETIEDVMERGLIRKANKDEEATTMMVISDEIRLGILQLKNKQAVQWTIEQIAIHGFSCIEHGYSHQVNEIGELQLELSYAKSKLIKEYTSGTKVSLDSIRKKRKQGIKIRRNILNGMSRYADVLSLDKSTVFRICMYFSFVTSRSIASDIKEKAKIEKKNFEEQIEDMFHIFSVLKKDEEKRWKKN